MKTMNHTRQTYSYSFGGTDVEDIANLSVWAKANRLIITNLAHDKEDANNVYTLRVFNDLKELLDVKVKVFTASVVTILETEKIA